MCDVTFAFALYRNRFQFCCIGLHMLSVTWLHMLAVTWLHMLSVIWPVISMWPQMLTLK